jgi:hypothetical protein
MAEAQRDSTLKAKQYAVLAANHAQLTKAIARDLPVSDLVNPAVATSEPYTNPTGL